MNQIELVQPVDLLVCLSRNAPPSDHQSLITRLSQVILLHVFLLVSSI